MVKRLLIGLALVSAAPTLSAKKRERAPDSETMEFRRPTLRIKGDSIHLSTPVTFYGNLGGTQLWHRYAVFLAPKADTAAGKLLYTNVFRGRRRENHNLRGTGRRVRHQVGAGKLARLRLKKEKKRNMILNMYNTRESWMDQPLVMIVRQYHSDKLQEPVRAQPEQVFEPHVFEADPETGHYKSK